MVVRKNKRVVDDNDDNNNDNEDADNDDNDDDGNDDKGNDDDDDNDKNDNSNGEEEDEEESDDCVHTKGVCRTARREWTVEFNKEDEGNKNNIEDNSREGSCLQSVPQALSLKSSSMSQGMLSEMSSHDKYLDAERKRAKDSIFEFVKDELFPKVKFTNRLMDLEWDNWKFAMKIMAHMRVPCKDRKQWWSSGNKKIAKKALQDKRSSVNGAVKETVKRKFVGELKTEWPSCIPVKHAELMRANKWPPLDDIMKLRQNKNGAYRVFCNHVLATVVGENKWKKRSADELLSQYATVSDEAFALLLIENSLDFWRHQVAPASNDSPKPLYTLNGAGTRENKGWTDEGIRQYNELAGMVAEDCKGDKNNIFENGYMIIQDEEERMNGSKRKQAVQKAGIAVVSEVEAYAEDDSGDDDEDQDEA